MAEFEKTVESETFDDVIANFKAYSALNLTPREEDTLRHRTEKITNVEKIINKIDIQLLRWGFKFDADVQLWINPMVKGV